MYKRIVIKFNTTFLELKALIFYHKNCIAPYRSQNNPSHNSGGRLADKVGKKENKNAVENEMYYNMYFMSETEEQTIKKNT